MTIRFECECGATLRAADELAGRDLQCPACKRPITVPVETTVQGILATPNGDAEDAGLEEQIDKMTLPEDIEDREMEPFEDTVEYRPQDQEQKRGWFRSHRFLILAGGFFVLMAALIGFMVMRQEDQASEMVVAIQNDAPLSEKPRNREADQEVNRLEGASGGKSLLTAKEQPLAEISDVTGVNEDTEQSVITQRPGSMPVSETSSMEEEEIVRGMAEENTESEPAIPEEKRPDSIGELGAQPGSYTVNLGSFREKENADRFVRELKKEGLEAFCWEIDLPEKGKWHRVSVGNFPTLENATSFVIQERLKETYSVFIVRVPGA
jgi:cell division septation protein DedD